MIRNGEAERRIKVADFSIKVDAALYERFLFFNVRSLHTLLSIDQDAVPRRNNFIRLKEAPRKQVGIV